MQMHKQILLLCVCCDIKIPGCTANDIPCVNFNHFFHNVLVFLPGFIQAWNAYSLLAVLLFLFSKATIPALGPMGCPVQWVVGAFSSGIKW